MRRLLHASTVAVALALVAPVVHTAPFQGMDPDRVVPGGGVFVQGWKGAIPDALTGANAAGVIANSKVTGDPSKFTINSGPPGIFWNPSNVAKGDYTVKATFNEPKIKSAMSHAHPYGVFIAGNKLDTGDHSLLYCAPYGEANRFIVRGFGPTTWGPGGSSRATTNPAVHVAGADGSVTQDVAMSVKGDAVTCSINGTEVWKAMKADLVGPGKLDSLDGAYGVRVSHNTDVIVIGFGKS
jgi:hypothetical protein